MEARTAIAVAPNTLENNKSFIGLQSVAGAKSETNTINNEKKEANIPAVTISFAFFLPYTSLIISVIKKVRGYGRIPTDISNR